MMMQYIITFQSISVPYFKTEVSFETKLTYQLFYLSIKLRGFLFFMIFQKVESVRPNRLLASFENASVA